MTRLADRIAHWLARRLPRRLIYWAVVHGHAIASTGRWSNSACPVPIETVLNRLAVP